MYILMCVFSSDLDIQLLVDWVPTDCLVVVAVCGLSIILIALCSSLFMYTFILLLAAYGTFSIAEAFTDKFIFW